MSNQYNHLNNLIAAAGKYVAETEASRLTSPRFPQEIKNVTSAMEIYEGPIPDDLCDKMDVVMSAFKKKRLTAKDDGLGLIIGKRSAEKPSLQNYPLRNKR